MHPLQTIRDPSKGAEALRTCAFTVAGASEACNWAAEMTNTLSGDLLHIEAEARPLYHAAAVMASNYIAALLHSAEHLMILAGIPRAHALRALGPLVRTSVDNVLDLGPAESLTGPVVRGDADTVAGHLQALTAVESSVTELYRAAGRHALCMARERGLGEEEVRSLQHILLGRQ
jgi:predicted short-subunit dehydrogenase-like oxidoreductase (DUF2520 family)